MRITDSEPMLFHKLNSDLYYYAYTPAEAALKFNCSQFDVERLTAFIPGRTPIILKRNDY